MNSLLIEVNNVSKIYRSKESGYGVKEKLIGIFKPTFSDYQALSDISFTLLAGKSLAILGPNGAGKSSLIKILAGVQAPDQGEVSVLGVDPYKVKGKLFRQLGVVFGHKNCLLWDLPLINSLDMVSKIYRIESSSFKKEQAKIFELLNIHHIINKPVRLLSLGERVKGELAFNLLFKPRVLFLDEPTIGLDINAKHEIRELLSTLKSEDNIGFIITSHDMGDIEGYVDNISLLHRGKQKFYGDLASLKTISTPLIKVNINCDSKTQAKALIEKVTSLSIRSGVLIEHIRFNEEAEDVEISVSQDQYTIFIKALVVDVQCAFSVSTPSLEEILRARFKEFS
ncbi:ATP-binding cassette domain-containing protein [Photorhabdus laumondii]|uniref:ATP-binding cassette domain-containing protein n=1 Tax=Photorhabdus laumondii TaxID=2218628 RepID=UPI00331484EB